MPDYEGVKNKQNQLIRKALQGSVFVAEFADAVITNLTQETAAGSGIIELAPLPTGYEDVGFVTSDGAQFAREVENSDVTSWGAVEPTRRDILSDVTTLTISAQETKKNVIGLYTGVDPATITADATTGEVNVEKPDRPARRQYRVLALAVDENSSGEIYVARFLPRAEVTTFGEQQYSAGEAPILFPVTWTGFFDSVEGYSERYIFGGEGWQAILTDAGF